MKSKILIITLIAITFSLMFVSTACDVFNPFPDFKPPETSEFPSPTPAVNITPEPTPEPTPDNTPDNTPTPGEQNVFTGRPFPFEFTSVDIYGNTVTEVSLGEKELFFIHYWATWCPPCIAEMPDLAQLERDYEDRVGFLVLLGDFDNKAGAIEIYENFGFPDIDNSVTICGETVFAARHEIMQMLSIQYIPTTVIIDADGNMLEHLIGAHFGEYAGFLDRHLGISN